MASFKKLQVLEFSDSLGWGEGDVFSVVGGGLKTAPTRLNSPCAFP